MEIQCQVPPYLGFSKGSIYRTEIVLDTEKHINDGGTYIIRGARSLSLALIYHRWDFRRKEYVFFTNA